MFNYDYIIVGGGTAGCVVASRLKQYKPASSILILEAGPDVSDRPGVPDGAQFRQLLGSSIDYNYLTTPQAHLGGRVIGNHVGKALGGSSAINAGGWQRGERANYDVWAQLVNDPRWSCESLLPYFRKVESHFDPDADPGVHGFNGPIKTESVTFTGCRLPLRSFIKEAWASVGVEHNPDINNGNPLGLGELVENRINGIRQLSSTVYPLHGVDVVTNTLVRRVVIDHDSKTATAGELNDGTRCMATTEIILSAGSYRTTQVLMLSGIGPALTRNRTID